MALQASNSTHFYLKTTRHIIISTAVFTHCQAAPQCPCHILCSVSKRRACDRRRQRLLLTCAISRHHAPHIQDTALRLQMQDSLKNKTENSFWPHADQNQRAPESGSWDVYQGIVYVWPSEPSSAFPDTSTTVLLPKSHRDWYPQLMAATSPHSRSHYCEIANLTDQNAAADLGELFRQGCRRAPMPEGSLLLWNSKTLHQGWTSGRRLAQPVCWEPKSRRDHAALVRKAAMSIRGLPSTHWASLGKTGQRAHLCAVLRVPVCVTPKIQEFCTILWKRAAFLCSTGPHAPTGLHR